MRQTFPLGDYTRAEVAGGRILVHPTLADALSVRNIPGGVWDASRKAFSFPATPKQAARIKAHVRVLLGSVAFRGLLATKAAPRQKNAPVAHPAPRVAPTPAPEPESEPEPLPDIPGLRTRPWRHQIAAFRFCLEHFEKGLRGVLLAMGMGCIDGDAELMINRRGSGRRIKMREFHRKFHGGESNGRRWQNHPTRTRSLFNGELRLNEVLDVIAQGVKPVVRVTLASGKSLRLTPDHEIACPGGSWVEAGRLRPGDVVLTNGTPACKSCGGTHRVVTYRYAKHVGICRTCIGRAKRVKGKVIDKDGYVRLYGMEEHPRANKAGQVYEHIIVMERLLGREVAVTEHVHHKNNIRHDNRPENLELLPAKEHYRKHGRDGGYLHLDGGRVHFIPKPDVVVSVEPDGETDVYDIRMAAPGHNFVANGIIVHNCGKTLVAIMLFLHMKARRVLIVSPLRVVPVWATQIERHMDVPVVVVSLDESAGSVQKKTERAQEKMRLAEARGVPFVVVINYDSVWRQPFAAWAERVRWDLVVADEAHRIRSHRGKASLWFKRLRRNALHRIGLTGTPMPHGPLDVFAILRFLETSVFGGSFTAFRQKYAVMGGFQRKQVVGFQRLDEFEKALAKVTFRVGKEVLDLPPETHVTYECDLGAEAARIYRDLSKDFVAQVREGIVTAANAMVKLLRLQQLTGGAVRTDEGIIHRIDDAKLKLLADTLEDIGPDEPVVVFCRFHMDLDAVHEACKEQGYTSLELSGRQDDLKRWQDGEAQVLAVQISAGGVGVDLTRARYSLYYSVGFSLGDYEQSLSRVHRPGQTKPVTHIHLLARNTVDQKIMRALEKRADIVESILAEIRN